MNTPLEQYSELAKAIGSKDIYFKREDLHPYGSHKGRSIPVMIDYYVKQGDQNFVISSSGNAALAAALHVKEFNSRSKEPIDLTIFIGNHAAPHKAKKLKDLADDHVRVLVKERPVQAATQAANEGARSLRQSIDDTALIGYEELASELAKAKNACAVFIGTSSGTTAQALSAFFLNKKLPIQVHIVQTSSCHPLSEEFESYDGPDEASIADAISDIVGHRKAALIPLIEKTGGRGWIATNEHIEAAQDLVSKYCSLEISTNSALSVAGLMQAVELGHELPGPAICMICGD